MSRIDEESTPIILPDGSIVNRRIRRGEGWNYITYNGRTKEVVYMHGKYFLVNEGLTDSKFYVII